jgi:hypothetical protein
MKIADIAGCRRRRRKKTKEEKGRHQDPLGRFSETKKSDNGSNHVLDSS